MRNQFQQSKMSISEKTTVPKLKCKKSDEEIQTSTDKNKKSSL